MKSVFAILLFIGIYNLSLGQKGGVQMQSGIGVSVLYDSATNLPYISDILSNSPAAKAGLRTGDKILQINGKFVKGLSDEKALKLLAGKEETTLQLKTQRGSVEKDYQLKRSKYQLPQSEAGFCASLEKILNTSMSNFDSLKIPIGDPGSQYESSINLPGFDGSYVELVGKTVKKWVFRGWAYQSKDSIQATYKQKKIENMLNSCLENSKWVIDRMVSSGGNTGYILSDGKGHRTTIYLYIQKGYAVIVEIYKS